MASNPDIANEVETMDEVLEDLITQSENNFEALTPMLARLSKVSATGNAEILEKYALQVQDACKAWEDRNEKAKGIRLLSIALSCFYSARFTEAMEPCEEALKILGDSAYTDLFGMANMIYGSNNRSLGELDTAVKHLIRAGELISISGPLAVYKCYSNYQLAEINNYIKDFEAAETHYRNAVSIAEDLGEDSALFRAYNGLANLYLSKSELEKCKEYLDRCLALDGLTNSQKSRGYCDLGIYFHELEEYENAENTLKISYDLRIGDGLRDAASTSLICLAKTQIALGKLDEALKSLVEAEEIILDYKSRAKELQCRHLMADVYYRLGEWQKSAEEYKAYDVMRVAHSIKQLQNIYKIKNEKIKSQKATIETIYEEVQASIRYAKRIQQAILPPDKLINEYLKDNFVLYKPKDIVSGDFYWLEPVEGATLFAVADCTGHGVPGAMVSVVCNNALNRSVREFGLTDPGEILTKVREIVIQEFEKSDEDVMDGMDIALCSLEGNELKYAGAYNPLWIVRSGEIIETKANKQPIGQFDDPVPYTTHSFDLEARDTFYIFSDGYVDQFGGPKGKKFKAKQFKKLLLSIQSSEMTAQKDLIDEAFEKWRGSLEQIDDVCVIGVKI